MMDMEIDRMEELDDSAYRNEQLEFHPVMADQQHIYSIPLNYLPDEMLTPPWSDCDKSFPFPPPTPPTVEESNLLQDRGYKGLVDSMLNTSYASSLLCQDWSHQVSRQAWKSSFTTFLLPRVQQEEWNKARVMETQKDEFSPQSTASHDFDNSDTESDEEGKLFSMLMNVDDEVQQRGVKPNSLSN